MKCYKKRKGQYNGQKEASAKYLKRSAKYVQSTFLNSYKMMNKYIKVFIIEIQNLVNLTDSNTQRKFVLYFIFIYANFWSIGIKFLSKRMSNKKYDYIKRKIETEVLSCHK